MTSISIFPQRAIRRSYPKECLMQIVWKTCPQSVALDRLSGHRMLPDLE